MKIPFISNVIEQGRLARDAWKNKNIIQVLHHGSGAAASTIFPPLLIHETYKMIKPKQVGFIKESGIVGGAIKGLAGTGKFLLKHPLLPIGVAGGIGVTGLGISAGKALKTGRKIYPQIITGLPHGYSY